LRCSHVPVTATTFPSPPHASFPRRLDDRDCVRHRVGDRLFDDRRDFARDCCERRFAVHRVRVGDDHAVELRLVEQRFDVLEIRNANLTRVSFRLRRWVGDAGQLEGRIVVQDAEMLAADQAGADDADARHH
jgi:hypothetical protein